MKTLSSLFLLVLTCKVSVAQWTNGTNIYNTNSGNVGVGTTSPQSRFETVGTGRFSSGENGSSILIDGSALPTANNWSNVRFMAGGNGGSAYLKTAIDNWGGYFSWTRGSAAGALELMRIDGTTHIAKLEVAGEVSQTGRTTRLWGAGSNENQALMFAGWGRAHGGIYWRGDSRTFTLNTGDDADSPGQYGNANLIVTGNVGIGTTTPSSKLTVAGDIHARKVKVTINAGADFVFEDSYDLQKLEDLQKYIQQHKHLPDIPSAKEMETKGIELGEMNIKLLQKIEELTLYILEQNRKIEEQDKKINLLQRKNIENVQQAERMAELEKQIKEISGLLIPKTNDH